jgi:hypothetical protein
VVGKFGRRLLLLAGEAGVKLTAAITGKSDVQVMKMMKTRPHPRTMDMRVHHTKQGTIQVKWGLTLALYRRSYRYSSCLCTNHLWLFSHVRQVPIKFNEMHEVLAYSIVTAVSYL